MKHTLLLRLKAPMQSWGISSRFSIRETGKEPSKSGVIGLLCAALGISRDEANTENPRFDELRKLKMNVRVLREGVMQKDFHTAVDVVKADGTVPSRPKHPKFTSISDRWYLADADFLVGLESEDSSLLESLQVALKSPKWQLFLGRKAFVPSVPVYFATDGLQIGESEIVLREFEIASKSKEQRLIIEDKSGREVRQDVPLDFAARRFSIRRVETKFIEIKGDEKDGDLFDENDSESEMLESAA
jgi:CRISPR system Cascade subunit CasD